MNPKTLFLAGLLGLSCSLALALDPTDEDISYMLNTTTPGYGYDKAAHESCLAKGKKAATSAKALKALSETCRERATPKKCRQLSVVASIGSSKSPQQVCQEACQSAGKSSRDGGECSLN